MEPVCAAPQDRNAVTTYMKSKLSLAFGFAQLFGRGEEERDAHEWIKRPFSLRDRLVARAHCSLYSIKNPSQLLPRHNRTLHR